MEIIYGLMIGLHILVSVLLIIAILLQPGKAGGGMGVFGGGSSSSVFGGRGATTILSKATGIMAAIFLVLSVAIAISGSERSVTDEGGSGGAPTEPLTPPPPPPME